MFEGIFIFSSAVGGLIVFVLPFAFIVRLIRSSRKEGEAKFVQLRLYQYGMWMYAAAIIFLVGPAFIWQLPREAGSITRASYDISGLSDTNFVIWSISSFIGLVIAVAGYRFMVSALKTKEETPRWIAYLMKFLK